MLNSAENAEMQLAQQRHKLRALMSHEDAIQTQSLDSKVDFNAHKTWIIKLIKRTAKLEENLEFDFITELSVLRKRQAQLDELLAMNTELERHNHQLTEEVNNFREQEMDRNFQASVESQHTAHSRRESQRFNIKSQSQAMEMEVAGLRHLLEQSDYKCGELDARVRQQQKELYEVNNRSTQLETELYQVQPKLQETLFTLHNAQEANQSYQRQLKSLTDETNTKDEELFTLQTEYMSFKRQTNLASEKRQTELDSIKDKLCFYKKNVERLTADKDRFKIKLKQADESKTELNKRIQDFEMLQETLNKDRKRIDEQLNKINFEDDFRGKFNALEESLTSTRSGMMIDSEVTAVIDEDRTHIRIIDANGKEQLKVRLIEPDIVLDEEVEVQPEEMDNSMLALETENQFPVKKQAPRFTIHAPDYDQSDSLSYQVNAPRRHNVKSMVFLDDEVEDHFEPDDSGHLQPELQQQHFGDRSFVSGNNSFNEGGIELVLPPSFARGQPQKTFFGFGQEDAEENSYCQEVAEQNSFLDVVPFKTDNVSDHNQSAEKEDQSDQEFQMQLPKKNKKAAGQPEDTSRFTFKPKKNLLEYAIEMSENSSDLESQEEKEAQEVDEDVSSSESEQKVVEVDMLSSESEVDCEENQEQELNYDQIEFAEQTEVTLECQEVQTDPVDVRQIVCVNDFECQTDQIQPPTQPDSPNTAPLPSKVDAEVQTTQEVKKDIGIQISVVDQFTAKKEYKTIGTNTKAVRNQNQTIQTDGKYFTEQEEVYYKLTRSTQDGSTVQQEARLSTSTMGSFARMPHDTMSDIYGDNGFSESQPKKASGIVKTSSKQNQNEPRKDDESCMPGCKVQ